MEIASRRMNFREIRISVHDMQTVHAFKVFMILIGVRFYKSEYSIRIATYRICPRSKKGFNRSILKHRK